MALNWSVVTGHLAEDSLRFNLEGALVGQVQQSCRGQVAAISFAEKRESPVVTGALSAFMAGSGGRGAAGALEG